MTSSRFIVSFTIKLLLVLLCAWGLHYLAFNLQHIDIGWQLWSFSYLSNFLMTSCAILIIYNFRISHTSSLGYIFLLTSLLKLVTFPLFIQPILIESCPHSTHAFLLFFVPYFVSLMVEINVLIKLLNRL